MGGANWPAYCVASRLTFFVPEAGRGGQRGRRDQLAASSALVDGISCTVSFAILILKQHGWAHRWEEEIKNVGRIEADVRRVCQEVGTTSTMGGISNQTLR